MTLAATLATALAGGTSRGAKGPLIAAMLALLTLGAPAFAMGQRPQQTPAEQAAEHGEALWSRDPDRCCALRKVEPNDRALAGAKLWIAALRRDESSSRRDTPLLSAVTLPSGWFHVRGSNTEPIIRVVAEGPSDAEARAVVKDVFGRVATIVNG
jgi:hypothetical protein